MKQYFLFFGALMFVASAVQAENEVVLPSCGTNCTYTIENNVLTISPIDSSQPAKIQSYDRYGYEATENPVYAPWRFKTDITKIVINEGVASIGHHSFEDMSSVKEVSLPEGLQSIGSESFHNIRSLEKINLPESLRVLGSWSLGTTAISEIIIPENLTAIGGYSFTDTKIENIVIPANITSLSAEAFLGSNGYQKTPLKNLYCEAALMDQCAAAVAVFKGTDKEVQVISYQKTDDDRFFYKNKWYNNANDILSGDYAKKRIYTVDEASKVTGKKNSLRIRYK